ncbi:MAG: AIPR family protein [Ruegeria sp.]
MSVELKRGFVTDAVEAYAAGCDEEIDDAFMYWFYSLLFEVEYDEIPLDEVVDGAGERQIDLFRIAIDESKQTASIHLIQVKNTDGFSANVVSLMKAGLDFIFKSKREDFERIPNPNFVEKISNVRDAMGEFGNTSFDVHCYFVTLGDEADISDEAQQNATNVRNEYGESQVFGSFSYEFIGVNELNRLVNLRKNQNRIIDYDLPIIYDANRASIIEFDSAGVSSLLCTVSGKELSKLALTEPRDAVFDFNVRGNLGLGGQINKNIHASSIDKEKAKQFWFMNNGITMVCDEFDISRDPDSPLVKLKNLQIINGCQTTSSLRSAFEDDVLLDEVRLQLKIYASKDNQFVNNVVIATNNQNTINTRDLNANDEIQQLIQQKISEEFELLYERKRGEGKSENQSVSNVIKMEKAGQAYLAIFKRQPTVSRAQKYKVYSNELYDDIFGKSKPWQLAIAHELYRFCEARGRKAYRELKHDDPSRNILNYGVFHIARILWWVLENQAADDAAFLAKLKSPPELMKLIRQDDAEIQAAYERSRSLMQEVVEANNESLINLNNYFKKAQPQQDINKQLKGVLAAEPDEVLEAPAT